MEPVPPKLNHDKSRFILVYLQHASPCWSTCSLPAHCLVYLQPAPPCLVYLQPACTLPCLLAACPTLPGLLAACLLPAWSTCSLLHPAWSTYSLPVYCLVYMQPVCTLPCIFI